MIAQDLTAIINRSKKTLGVSRAEIEHAMAICTYVQDTNGLKELFHAYSSWEKENKKQGLTDHDALQLALENFDFVASVADNIQKYKSVATSLAVAVRDKTQPIGPIRRFYRTAVGYNPIDPQNN